MNTRRLLKLARHLETGKLGHERFDFSTYSSIRHNEAFKENGCGTMGCALGECPIVWPKQWHFETYTSLTSEPFLSTDSTYDTTDDAMKFFDISEDEVMHLFMPAHQQPDLYGGSVLIGKVTKEEVAANIREFVKAKKSHAQRTTTKTKAYM